MSIKNNNNNTTTTTNTNTNATTTTTTTTTDSSLIPHDSSEITVARNFSLISAVSPETSNMGWIPFGSTIKGLLTGHTAASKIYLTEDDKELNSETLKT